MQSDLGFGDLLRYRTQEGAEREECAGTYFKIALPHRFFDGAFVGYVDADELLVLPPGVTSIREVVARLDDAGAPSAVASVVAFFPTSAEGLEGELPQSLGVLIDAYPWFQCEAFVRFCPVRQPDLIGESKIACIFRRFDVKPGIVCKGWHRLWMPSRMKKARAFQKSPRHKTPLVRWDGQSRLTGSHYGNLPPSPDVLLTMAYFVFTAQFADKIARATAWGAHPNAAAKYRYYATFLEKMRGVENAFLDKGSRRYEGPQQLWDCGLMCW